MNVLPEGMGEHYPFIKVSQGRRNLRVKGDQDVRTVCTDAMVLRGKAGGQQWENTCAVFLQNNENEIVTKKEL